MGWTQSDIDRRNAELGIAPQGFDAAISSNSDASVEWPEWMIEAEVTRLLQQDGWRSLRTDPVSDKGRGKGFGEVGMCDHLYIRYTPFYRQSPDSHYLSASHTLWIEFKSAKGKPAKHQIEWISKERARGALVLLAGTDFPASVEGFVAWYKDSGLKRRAR